MNWLPQTPVDWVPLIIALLIGWLIGWLLTRGPARRREEEYLGRISELDARWKKTDRELTDANQRVNRLQTSLADAESAGESLVQERNALQEQLAALDGEKSALASTVETRTAELNALQSDFEDAASRLAATQTEAESSNAALAQDVEALKADLSEQTERTVSLQGEIASLQDEIASLQGEREALQRQLADAEQRHATLGAELAAAVAAGDEARNIVDTKETALNEAYMAAARLQDRLDDRERRLARAVGELDDMRVKFVDLEQSQSTLEARLHSARGDVAGELAMLTSTMVKMKDDALKSANARIAALSKEVEELRGSDA